MLIFLHFVFLASSAQTTNSFIVNKHAGNISFTRMDSAHTSQTTVIEYPDFLVLIELPFVDMGGDKSTDLYEDVATADRFILFLKKEFKNKPVKYVLSTHWHLHSLSAITPFFKQGAKLITASSNWQYSLRNGFLGSADPKTFAKSVLKVTRDTTLLSKTKFPIDVIFLDSTYSHKPTKDYLFFYFPTTKMMHASCMCALTDVDFEKRKGFTYSDRITDLSRAIASRKLPVESIIKLGRFDQSPGQYLEPVFSRTYLEEFMENGKPMHVAVAQYTNLTFHSLLQQKDSILQDAITKKVSPQILNQAVYDF